MRVLKIATTHQSLVTILANKLALLSRNQQCEIYIASSFPEKFERTDTSEYFLPVKMSRNISLFWDTISGFKIFLLCKKYRFDVVHTHTAKAGFLGTLAAHYARVPVILHTYHGLPYYKNQNALVRRYYKFLELWANKYRSAVFSQTKSETEELKNTEVVTCPVFYEGNAVTLEEIEKRIQHDKLQEKFFTREHVKILFVSRLEYVKQPDVIVKVIKILFDKGIFVECIIAGKGILEAELGMHIKKLGLEKHIRILYTNNIYNLINSADIVGLLSLKEGIPRSIMEAMALKKPVVVSDVCGTNELVKHKVSGILVDPNNCNEMAEAIEKLVKDPTLRKEMGEEGFKRIKGEYGNEEKIVSLWLSVYNAFNPQLNNCNNKQGKQTILIVTTVAYTTEAFLLPYIELFEKLGYTVIVAANWEKRWNRISPFIKRLHIPFSRKFTSLFNILSLVKLCKTLQSQTIAGIYTHTPIASAIVRIAKCITHRSIPCIYEVHGQHFHENQNALIHWLYKTVETKLSPLSETIVTINKDDFAIAKSLYTKSTVEYVPGIGIDFEKYNLKTAQEENIRKTLNIKESVPVIVTIGELIPRKRIDCVIETAKILKNDGVDFVWVVAGTGPQEQKLKELAQSAGVSDRVIFIGFCNDIGALLSIASCFVLLSMHEGLPRSLLEAGALGVPCVVSEIRGNRDVIDHEKNSYLVKNQNCAIAAKYLKILIQEPQKAKTMGSLLKKRIEEEFSLSVTLQEHEKIFKRSFQKAESVPL